MYPARLMLDLETFWKGHDTCTSAASCTLLGLQVLPDQAASCTLCPARSGNKLPYLCAGAQSRGGQHPAEALPSAAPGGL